jgi:hypothetical protein
LFATAKVLVRPALAEGYDELHEVGLGEDGFVV